MAKRAPVFLSKNTSSSSLYRFLTRDIRAGSDALFLPELIALKIDELAQPNKRVVSRVKENLLIGVNKLAVKIVYEAGQKVVCGNAELIEAARQVCNEYGIAIQFVLLPIELGELKEKQGSLF